MKIRVLSDLHLEFEDWAPPAVQADVVVLAGDIHGGTKGLAWAREEFPHTPIVYVPGNHEYFTKRLVSGNGGGAAPRSAPALHSAPKDRSDCNYLF